MRGSARPWCVLVRESDPLVTVHDPVDPQDDLSGIRLSVPGLHQTAHTERTTQQNHAHGQRKQTCEFPSMVEYSQASRCRSYEADKSCNPYCPESQRCHLLAFHRPSFHTVFILPRSKKHSVLCDTERHLKSAGKRSRLACCRRCPDRLDALPARREHH